MKKDAVKYKGKKIIFGVSLAITLGMTILLFIMYASHVYNPFILVFGVMIQTWMFTSVVGLVVRYYSVLEQTITDPLTQIYNRKHFFDELQREIDRSVRTGEKLSILLFDIDDFKKINDEYGHYSGDQALVSITSTIKRTIRPYDTFARLGGEEFGVILPNLDQNEAFDIAERIRIGVEESRLNRKIPVTISIGLTEYLDHDSPDDMYKRTDDAMYEAKRCGKNQVVVWKSTF